MANLLFLGWRVLKIAAATWLSLFSVHAIRKGCVLPHAPCAAIPLEGIPTTLNVGHVALCPTYGAINLPTMRFTSLLYPEKGLGIRGII